MRHKSLRLLLLAAASRADLRREKKKELPCASTSYNGSQRIEKQNFSPSNPELRQPLYALAISAKRYVLFNVDEAGHHCACEE